MYMLKARVLMTTGLRHVPGREIEHDNKAAGKFEVVSRVMN